MHSHGIRAKGKRRFVVTTDSTHRMPVAPDMVQCQFTPTAPNVLCSGDITYIATDEGWLYLAAVLDLHSRQVAGWSLQAHMQTSRVLDALLMVCFQRHPPAGLIFHSDRGSQYCSQDFQDTLAAWDIRSSMSRKGNCSDNAPSESLWGRLKTAMRPWSEIRYSRAGKAGDHGLDRLLQPLTTTLDIGLPQPDAVRTTLVGGAAQICRLMIGLRTSVFRDNLSRLAGVQGYALLSLALLDAGHHDFCCS